MNNLQWSNGFKVTVCQTKYLLNWESWLVFELNWLRFAFFSLISLSFERLFLWVRLHWRLHWKRAIQISLFRFFFQIKSTLTSVIIMNIYLKKTKTSFYACSSIKRYDFTVHFSLRCVCSEAKPCLTLKVSQPHNFFPEAQQFQFSWRLFFSLGRQGYQLFRLMHFRYGDETRIVWMLLFICSWWTGEHDALKRIAWISCPRAWGVEPEREVRNNIMARRKGCFSSNYDRVYKCLLLLMLWLWLW